MAAFFQRCLLWLSLCLLFAVGCGGGSEGTGTEPVVRSIEGSVVSTDGEAVADARITILETGESSVSDSAGMFEILTTSTSDTVDLEIEKDGESARTTLNVGEDNTPSAHVTITFDPRAAAVVVDSLEVSVKIVGACDPYFENRRVIRQANAVPAGTTCTARIVTTSKGKPVGNISYGLRYRGCNDNAPVTELAAGLTSVAFNPGVGQVTFPYIDDAKHCVYEVVVPYKVSRMKPIIYQVLTFTKQGAGE